MNCRAVIFDLDGTLLDTLTDIADSANRVLAAHGFAIHDRDAYRWYVGDGSAILMTRALPEDQRTPEMIRACLQGFIADYSQNWHQATRPYDGLADLLSRLRDLRIHMSVVTNKPHRFAGSMMAHYFGGYHFDPILGQQDGIPKKPNPQMALAAAAQMDVTPSTCIFIGDSAVDMETARKADMQPVGAGWGFRPVGELIDAGALTVINHPLELLDLIVVAR
jgi:phosphoglycolate phosphatase